MTLPDDTSIPFPYDSPIVWDQWRIKGMSGQEYQWPLNPRFGLVKFKVTPPKIRIKKSVKAGNTKPKVKDVGEDLTKATVSFEVTGLGWPSWIANCWRLVNEVIDGPWRWFHPQVDTFDARLFKVESYMTIEDTSGGIVHASFGLIELSPDEQANLGKNVGVTATGAKQQGYALEQAAYDDWKAEQEAIQRDQQAALLAAKKADAARKPGVLVAKRLPVEKAISFGKINL